MMNGVNVMIKEGRKTDVSFIEELDEIMKCHLNYLALIDHITHKISYQLNKEIEEIYQSNRKKIKDTLAHIETIDVKRLSLKKIGYKLKAKSIKSHWAASLAQTFSRPEFIYIDGPFRCSLRENAELDVQYKESDFSSGIFEYVHNDYLPVLFKYINIINLLRVRYAFLTTSMTEMYQLKSFLYPEVGPLHLEKGYVQDYIDKVKHDYLREFENQNYIFKEYYKQIQMLMEQFVQRYKDSYIKQSELIHKRLKKISDYSGLNTVSLKMCLHYTSENRQKIELKQKFAVATRVTLRRYVGKKDKMTIYNVVKDKQQKYSKVTTISYKFQQVTYHKSRPVAPPFLDLVHDLVEDVNKINFFIKTISVNIKTINKMFVSNNTLNSLPELVW